MKINFRGVGAEELSFKMNRVRLEPNARLDIKPQFSRQVRKVKDNDKLNFIALSMKVESTEAEPKPFDIHVTLVGTFEVEDVVTGRAQLHGVTMSSPDIRAGMAMVIAALCARGESTINSAEVIYRGYEKNKKKLSALGAKIREVKG